MRSSELARASPGDEPSTTGARSNTDNVGRLIASASGQRHPPFCVQCLGKTPGYCTQNEMRRSSVCDFADLVDGGMTGVHHGAVVHRPQQVELDKLVTLAIEAAGDATSSGHTLTIGDGCEVGDVTGHMDPRTELDVGAEDQVGGEDQPTWVGNGVIASVDRKVVAQLVEKGAGLRSPEARL